MSDINPNALSLEDAPPAAQIESLPTAQEPSPPETPDDEAVPEGAVEHQGQRMVPVSVLAAERRRVRETTAAAIREKELAPLQQTEQQLRNALNEARPYIDLIRQHGVPQTPKPSKAEELVSDEDAAAEARDLELYDGKTGQPDIQRAKRIIARRRSDVTSAAQQAAQEAIAPDRAQTAQSQSRDNFARMAMAHGSDDQPIAPPGSPQAKILAEMWVTLPPELTAHPEVAELVRDAAIGKHLRTAGRVPRAERAPTFSEPAGGRVGPQFEMDRMAKSLAKNAGISDAEFKKTAGSYTPGATNVLGD